MKVKLIKLNDLPTEIKPGVVGDNLPGHVVHVGKSVVEMSAEMRINVVDVKLAIPGSVESPGAVVTDHLLPTIRDLGGFSWRRGGFSWRRGGFSWSVRGP